MRPGTNHLPPSPASAASAPVARQIRRDAEGGGDRGRPRRHAETNPAHGPARCTKLDTIGHFRAVSPPHLHSPTPRATPYREKSIVSAPPPRAVHPLPPVTPCNRARPRKTNPPPPQPRIPRKNCFTIYPTAVSHPESRPRLAGPGFDSPSRTGGRERKLKQTTRRRPKRPRELESFHAHTEVPHGS